MDIMGLTHHHPTGRQKFHSVDDTPKSGTCGMMSLLLVFHIFQRCWSRQRSMVKICQDCQNPNRLHEPNHVSVGWKLIERLFSVGIKTLISWFHTSSCFLFNVLSTLHRNPLPSGKRLHNYGKSPFLMGKSAIKWPFSNCQFTRGYSKEFFLGFQQILSFAEATLGCAKVWKMFPGLGSSGAGGASM